MNSDPKDELMTAKITHSPGPYTMTFGSGYADLAAAPHHCDDPTCPGDVNRRKLEAFEILRDALGTIMDPERPLTRRR